MFLIYLSSSKRKKSAIEELIEEETHEKIQKQIRQREKLENPWLKQGIIVKVVSKNFGEKYYKQKGEVIKVIDKFKGLVNFLNDNFKVTIDQNDLETVIPGFGRKVLVLNGKYRGCTAILESLDQETFKAYLKLCDEKDLISLPYEHFSKLS